MTAIPETLELSRCEACRARFLPTDGACPACGSIDVRAYVAPALGTVLAATELTSPAEGWTSPHRLALVELPEAVRLFAIVDGSAPAPGAVVSVRRDGEVYRARAEPEPRP
ncbi:MAG: Zn-ribbon domain-containing OB-fold protein [Thermoplasmata archaeon]